MVRSWLSFISTPTRCIWHDDDVFHFWYDFDDDGDDDGQGHDSDDDDDGHGGDDSYSF